jgi:AcrR family transcriptional regulator
LNKTGNLLEIEELHPEVKRGSVMIEAGARPSLAKRPDRRIVRTRQLLRTAFREVLQEKSFASISIQDITERANVNRGTFYAHFADKYALMDADVREDFQQLLAGHVPPGRGWSRKTLRRLIQIVLEYYAHIYRECRMSVGVDPLVERAAHEELTRYLVEWLNQEMRPEAPAKAPVETIAHVMSGAIFGAAAQWSQSKTAISSGQMANDVLLVLTEGVDRLAPGALLE